MNSRVYRFVGEHDPRSCINCRIGHLCLGNRCTRPQLLHIDQHLRHQMPVKRNTTIVGQNSPFTDCYVVKAGAVKTVFLNKRGDEKIMGFYLPGEVFGLEGILEGCNTCSAVALEQSTVCKINYRKLREFASEVPALQEWLLSNILQELHSMEVLNRWLSYTKAEERVVSFLMDLAERQRLRTWHTGEVRLPMSRQDIGNYLGLALETVSRALHRLERKGELSVRNRHIELLDLESLKSRVTSVETTLVSNIHSQSHVLADFPHVPPFRASSASIPVIQTPVKNDELFQKSSNNQTMIPQPKYRTRSQ